MAAPSAAMTTSDPVRECLLMAHSRHS